MAVLDILNTYNSDVYLDIDPGWRGFISDHKSYLKSVSPRRLPSDELMTQLHQDLPRYLRHIGYARPISWIIAYINDLDSDIYFDHSMTIYVPTLAQIDLLYQSYITTRQLRK